MPYIASMGIYVVSKDAMMNLLSEKFPEANDFGSEVIPGATSIGMIVQAYLYDGYWEDIGTIEAFYNANLGITKKPISDFKGMQFFREYGLYDMTMLRFPSVQNIGL